MRSGPKGKVENNIGTVPQKLVMRKKELLIVPDDGVVKPYDSFKNHIGFQNKEKLVTLA